MAVTALDAVGMIDAILDNFPESERDSDATHYSQTLRTVLAARAPALTLPRIERLLWYGLFDWAITDSDALWAYFLVRTLPLADQDAWRVRDDGTWFGRLEANLPDAFRVSSAYSGVGSEFTGGLPSGRPADPDIVDMLLTRIWGHWGANHDATSAIWVTRTLLGLDPAELTWPAPDPPSVEVRTQAVRRFDAGGDLDDLYNSFPDNYIYNQPGRGELLDLNAMRDPVHLAMRASALLSTGLSDWWVSSREAWIAYQLVRALSPEQQERFQQEHANEWSSMMSAMTPEMRASTASTPLSGRGPWPSREQLRERLRDDRLWNPEHADQLRALIDILRAADDGAFVFEESSRHTNPKLGQLFADLRLYGAGIPPRTTYQAEEIRGRAVGVDVLDFAGMGIRGALVLIGSLFVVDIFNRTINATGYNLDWLQWAMGGDLEGARLAERPSGPPPGGTRAAAAAAMGDHEGWPGEDLQANRLSFQTDLQNGIVHLTLPELLLDSVNFVRAGSAYRTGRVRLVDLIVTASFSDRHYRNPVGVEATAMEVGIDDMVVANPSVGALALAHLFLSALAFNSRALGNEDLDEVQLERGLTPIWILGPLLELLANVVAIRGTVPFGPSLVDLALMPVTAGMPMWQSTPIGWVANALVPSPHPVDYAWGLFSDGTLRPPRTVSERAADAMRLLRSVDLHFGELTIEGLSLGSGIETASLTIRDLDIGAARSRPAYLRQLISSLDLAWARADPAAQAAIQQRRDEALAELYGTPEHPGGLAALETELEGLERRDRWIAGSLSDAESKRMAELSDLLRRDTGVVIDIGSIEVGEVTGRVQTAGARISNIHFDGHVPIDTGGAYYSDEELAARFLGRTQAPPATTPADAYLTIASAELLRGPKGSPILRIAADSVPTAEAVQDRLKAMPPGANPELRARLEDVLPLLGELEQLRSPGHEPTPDEQKHITALTNTIRDRIGITVGSLSLGPITGGLDESGALTATVHGIDVQDVVVDGYSVRRVTGDLDLGVPGVARLAEESPALGAAATSERARGLAAHLGIDATIEQAESETGDVLERATLDISGDVRATPDGLALSNVWLGRLALEAVTIGAPGADLYLHGDRVTAEGISADAEVHFADTGGERHFASAVITNLRIDRLSGGNLVYESTDTHAGRRLHVEAPSGALGGVVIQNVTIARDSAAGLAIDASATAGGLEVVGYTAIRTTLSDGSTKTVTGTLRGGAMPDVRTAPPPPPGTSPTAAEPVAGSPSGGPAPVLSASYVSDASGSTISLGPHDLDALGTEIVIGPGRSIVIRQARVSTAPGASTGIELTDQATRFAVTFGNVKLGAVRWESGEMLVTSDAGTTATSAIATGRLQSGDPNAKDPAERNDYLQIDDLDIHELDAPQLTFYWPPFQIDLGRTHAHQGALRAVRVHLLGFRLPFAADGSPGSPTAGHLEVTGTHVDLRALIADGLAARVTSPDDIRASGELDVDAITVDIEGANHYVAHISGASAVADADTAAWALHAGLPDVEGTIEYTPEAVVIRDMRLGNAALDSLRLSTTVKNHLLNLTIDSGGGVYFTDIRGNARVNLWKKGESHPADAWCRSLAIDSLEIYRIDAEGLRLELPDDGVVITAPPMLSLGSAPLAPLVTLRHIVIAEPGGPSFEWQPGKAGFMRGTPRIDEITAPLVAEIAGKFHGVLELDTGETTIGLLERGEFTVDVANPRARMNDPAWLDTPRPGDLRRGARRRVAALRRRSARRPRDPYRASEIRPARCAHRRAADRRRRGPSRSCPPPAPGRSPSCRSTTPTSTSTSRRWVAGAVALARSIRPASRACSTTCRAVCS